MNLVKMAGTTKKLEDALLETWLTGDPYQTQLELADSLVVPSKVITYGSKTFDIKQQRKLDELNTVEAQGHFFSCHSNSKSTVIK